MAKHSSETGRTRLLIVPRWGGRPESDFYPWLCAELRARHAGLFDEVTALALPRPELPEITTWPAAIEQALGKGAEALASTYVLTHSVGCQALLRALAGLPAGQAIAGALFVAGWWEIDRPWDSIRPWLEAPPTLERSYGALRRSSVLLSDNDPFTADYQKNRSLWEARLTAEVTVVPSRKHFNDREEPAVLAALLELLRR